MGDDATDASVGVGTACGIAVPIVLALVAAILIAHAWSRQPLSQRSFAELAALLSAHVVGATTLLVLVPLFSIGAMGSAIASTGTRMFDPQSSLGAWMTHAVAWCLALVLSGVVTGPAMTLAAVLLAARRHPAPYVGALASALCALHHLLMAAALAAIAITAYDAPSDVAMRVLLLLLAFGVSFVGLAQAAALVWVARRARREAAG